MSPAEPDGVRLDGGQRLQVVDVITQVLDGAYAHLPTKRAGYATDPIQALRLLRLRCVEMSDAEFHRVLTRIVANLRDGHTRYRGPAGVVGTDGGLARPGQVAVLPFLAEQYTAGGRLRHLASHVAPNAATRAAGFVAGVELTSWNGIPFERAVELHADVEIGGHPDARRARALASLTLRPLDYGPPPDEQWVYVGFRGAGAPGGTGVGGAVGEQHEVRLDWRLVQPGAAPVAPRRGSPSALHRALDPVGEPARRAKKYLFAPAAWQADRADARAEQRVAEGTRRGRRGQRFKDAVAARTVTTPRGPVGHLRLWSFDVDDDDAFLAEVGGLLDRLPPTGLIVDLRGNPGGLVWAAERMLQLFTDTTITPARFSLPATAMTRAMAASAFNRFELGPWSASLDETLTTGDLWSRPIPLTDPAWCADLGRRYRGPAVAVVDAATYSSGDLFAAGWVDHRIGPLVAVGSATGAGGANVWSDLQLRDALLGTGIELPPLPPGVGFTLAVRRAVRSGAADGIPIEDLGVPGIPYAMSRRDLLDGNPDLLAFCADLLPAAAEPAAPRPEEDR